MDKFEKIKEELKQITIADPMVFIKKINFDSDDSLADYLEYLKEQRL